MTTPTPQQLATSLLDVALGYDAELVGTRPDPALGQHIRAMAKRVHDRVPAGDPRLDAFAPFTDPSGYVWLHADALHSLLTQAAAGHWSFERWLTSLADLARTLPPPDPADLAALAAEGARVDQLSRSGYRPTEMRPGGLVLKRTGGAA